MKKIASFRIALVLAGLFFAACNRGDELAPPKILLTEVGHDNSHVAYIGDDIHLEADIEAEGRIKSIFVELSHEAGNGYKIVEEWTSGKYIGVKNTEFHEHIDIPTNAPEGEYHLYLTVADREGNQSQASASVDIRTPNQLPNVRKS